MGEANNERVWLYAMFGFMMKDMWIFRNDVLFFLHHGIALAGVLVFFTVPAGLGQFLVGGTVLEMGNLTYNIVLLRGKDSGPHVSPTVKHLAEVLSRWDGGVQLRRYAHVPHLHPVRGAEGYELAVGPGRDVVRAHRGQVARAPV